MSWRIIDLSLTIQNKNSWTKYPTRMAFNDEEPPTKLEPFGNYEVNGILQHKLETTTQSFTHIDAPKHFYPDGLACDEVPLDLMVGEAAVIDMMHKEPGEGISADDLANKGAHLREGDIALIRTGWTDRAPWGTERYWRDMIYLEAGACDWLIEKHIKSLALDIIPEVKPFACCPECGRIVSTGKGSPNHAKFLKEGIILIEFLCNLGALSQQRIKLICLPLKIKGADGAPARVMAIEES